MSTNPQICLFSADQTDVNDYFVIDTIKQMYNLTGTGGFDIQGSIVNTGAGNGGDVLLMMLFARMVI